MHEALSAASQRVETLREQEWGRLGVLWFRFTLRRALREVDAGGPTDRRSVVGLARAVRRREHALAQGRDVLLWLEESLHGPGRQDDAVAGEDELEGHALRDSGLNASFAVVGSVARVAWTVAVPGLLVAGVIAGIAAAAASDADADDFDFPDDWRATAPIAAEERHASDATTGRWVVTLTAMVLAVAVAGAGFGFWFP